MINATLGPMGRLRNKVEQECKMHNSSLGPMGRLRNKVEQERLTNE